MDDVDSKGRTALHYAAEEASTSTVSVLLHRGANAASKDDKKRNVITYAAHKRDPSIDIVPNLHQYGCPLECDWCRVEMNSPKEYMTHMQQQPPCSICGESEEKAFDRFLSEVALEKHRNERYCQASKVALT